MQRIAFICFAAFLLSSFLAWPQTELILFNVVRVIGFLFILAFLVNEFSALRFWQLQFHLNELGEVRKPNNEAIYTIKKLWISDWFCAFCFMRQDEQGKQKRVETVLIFNDMLTDSSYRHLSRILLATERKT